MIIKFSRGQALKNKEKWGQAKIFNTLLQPIEGNVLNIQYFQRLPLSTFTRYFNICLCCCHLGTLWYCVPCRLFMMTRLVKTVMMEM